ncbi:class I SAM-dependent DNA methyltransferase [Psychromarinibacter halotolerans]|uniref:Class I SAM-dependent DNA methyltransferase n=1 Tax=Psychromarinibacter halotolerans TaxID=1775175 RepID=A0ABV7GQU5_9RHOB|nr:class I SAM-dependent methyltransferase [Psychromarinibacter halotolerans]MDF0597203.1 class I SAM-dependent methyltransferase [Psychromarinibacter halotolerans]
MSSDYDLDHAYTIDGPEDARRLYGNWAASYDDSFGAGWGYVAPREIANIFLSEMRENQPVLDIGAGTGLVAEHLRDVTVDGIDIAPEMLARAEAKGLYRRRILGDLTQPLHIPDGVYGGVVSCGTFTHGHVGPVCLPELLRITRPGALFACGTIPAVLDGMGFGSALAALVAAAKITPVAFREIAIYEGADHPHRDDRGLVMVFRKL